MEQPFFKTVFEYPIGEFKRHFANDFNERIVFSGRYGSGKTRFLEDCFEVENQKQIFGSINYRTYRISPVSYSIASNEDIIRYIKYDIIIAMLRNTLTLNEVKLTLRDTFPHYAHKNALKLVAALVYMIPKVGKEVVEIFEKIDGLKEEYLKYHDELNRSNGDIMIEYLEHLEMKSGSIYENDITTKIITETISKDDKLQNVLIIDDVDRLDPEHVFRLLNVFAAHFDSSANSGSKNKFNFGKIILVCDIKNIRTIFHHRYGTDVDFIGYIDKFYSSDIYHFDNKPALTKIIENILRSLKFDDDTGFHQKLYFKNDFLQGMITEFVQQGVLSLRGILKIYGRTMIYHFDKVTFDKENSEVPVIKNTIVFQLRILLDLFGDYRNLQRVIEQYHFTQEFVDNHQNYFGDLIYILCYKQHGFFRRAKEYEVQFHELHLVIDIVKDFRTDRFEYAQIFRYTGKNENNEFKKDDLFYVGVTHFKRALLDTIELLNRIGYLQ